MSSEPPCCVFTYESIQDWEVTRTAVGVACSWPDLQNRFARQGPPCPVTNGLHFRTISRLGPKLFAVDLFNLGVFYHDGYRWHQYQSARDVRFGKLEDFKTLVDGGDDDTDHNEDQSQEDNNGKDRDDDLGRQTKDSSLKNHSTCQLDRNIVYFCLLQIVLIIQLQNTLIQYPSFTR